MTTIIFIPDQRQYKNQAQVIALPYKIKDQFIFYMAIFSHNKSTKRLLRDDVTFINRIIADCGHLNIYPLTDRGRLIIKMLWEENKSFSQVAQQLSISKGRVIQIYRFEMRRLNYFIDSTFKDYSQLQKENELLKRENEELKARMN